MLDFGLARPLHAAGADVVGAAFATGEGVVLGTPAYMAPEQARGMRVEGMRAGQNFWLLDFETSEKRLLARLEDGGEMRAFDVDPNGERILFDRLVANSDVLLIERTED